MAMDFNIDIRKKQLESLDQFVTSSRNKVQSILESLGWTVTKIQEEQRLLVNCPHNDNHKIPAEKIEDHIDKCKLTSAGYDLQEEFISEPVIISEESNIKVDTNKKIEILCQAFSQKPYFQTAWNGKDSDPLTYSRLFSTFSTDERLVLYDYCIANTRGPPQLPEFDTSIMTKANNSLFTEEALKSFERDIKRRSVKYKPVHTNHKNYKDELRGVIDSQMQQYTDWLERVNRNAVPISPDDLQEEDSLEGGLESESQEKSHDYNERPFSSVSKLSNSSTGSPGTKHSKHDSHYEHHSLYSNSKRRHRYTHHDEDSQETNSISKVSSVDIDSSCENRDSMPRAHSRDSSVRSSHKKQERSSRYRDSRRHKSRRDSRDWKRRDHSSGSSRHSSRSHRSKDDRYYKHHSRERRHRDSRGDN